MKALLLHPTSTAQWHALVAEARTAAQTDLNESLESYLVFLLMRFTSRPEIANCALAVEYLESLLDHGRPRQDKLRDVGDRCLLFSGLFPLRAERRRVKISYFVDIGRSAYQELGDSLPHSMAALYQNLAVDFIILMDTLQAMRKLGEDQPVLSPFAAYDLWSDTGSTQALKSLQHHTDDSAIPVPPSTTKN